MMRKGYKFSEESKKKISDSLKAIGAGKWNVGRKASNETRIRMSLASRGRKKSDEHKRNISNAKTGDKNPLWKGCDVGYKSLHQWVKRNLGKADICQFCESCENVEWANKSHEYKRDEQDWIKLCKKCHHEYDREEWGKASRIFLSGLGGLGERL